MIAYVLPGFIALGGLAPLVPAIARWLRPVESSDLGIAPPLYAVLAATAIGLVLSCFRWVLLDHLHEWTGVKRPAWDDRHLERVLSAFDYVVQSHFRYYEFTGNTLLAMLCAYTINRTYGAWPLLSAATDAGVTIVAAVLFIASRNALKNYYRRTARLTGYSLIASERMSCSTATTTAARTIRLPSLKKSPRNQPR